ncbi:hypothetical protein E4418_15635 [Stenotrophomonas maltophilia]|nr:hypothetical protein E4418_15635 [Stenotrophomonas maltophilia]
MDIVQVPPPLDAVVEPSHARLLFVQIAVSRAWARLYTNVAIATLWRAPHDCNVFELSNNSHWQHWRFMQII